MRKPVHSTESSIEEILASIRNIIAEDGAAPKSSGQVQAHRPARQSTENPEDTPYEGHADNVSELNTAPTDLEQQAANAAESSDEILELTEDIMLAGMSQDAAASDQEDVTADLPPNDDFSQSISEEFRHAPLPEEEELDEVLSNLAAEVERLGVSETEQDKSLQEEFTAEQPVEKRANAGQGQQPEEDTRAFGVPDFAKPDIQTVGQSQVAGEEEPKPTVSPVAPPPPPYARQPAAPVAKSKPMWSARRLETPEKPSAPAPEKETAASQTDDEQSAQPTPPAARSSHASPVSRRDLWAEGVQMPVPDTGPEIPLPMSEDNSEMDRQRESAQEDEVTSAEKRTVGSFLTRVFGSAPTAEREDEPAEDETELRAKAEKLARDTISDFAEAKLNAPAMGNALKADKDFMDEVTSTLANALASTNEEADAEPVAKAELPQSTSGQVAEPETQSGTAIESGLDEKLKEALAADASVSEEMAVKAKPEDESASFAESAVPVLPQGTQDEAVQIAQEEGEVVSAATAAEYVDTVSAEQEAAASETAETEQATIVEEATAELPPEMPGDMREEPTETVASQEEEETASNAATIPSTPALNLPSSVEGSIKDMIKPLIIQWLNDNMPRIVEEALREELSDRTEMPKVTDKSRA